MGLTVTDITCTLSIILHFFKVCFFLTQACRPPTSGPVCSCYSSPCRWSRRGSLFHSQVCSWSVGWRFLLTGPYWSLVSSATCSVVYNVVAYSPAAGTDRPRWKRRNTLSTPDQSGLTTSPPRAQHTLGGGEDGEGHKRILRSCPLRTSDWQGEQKQQWKRVLAGWADPRRLEEEEEMRLKLRRGGV